MTEQILKRIEKAEQEAEKLVTLTQRKCQGIIEKTHRERAQITSRARAEAKKKGEQIEKEILRAAEREEEKIRIQFRQQEAEMNSPGKKQLREKAIELILRIARKVWEKT